MELNEALITPVMQQIFESMTFAFAETPPEQTPEPEKAVATRLTFEGPVSGQVILRVPVSLLPELARNMLGEAEGYTPGATEQCDVLGELLNVIAGNLLSAWKGTEPVFRLGVPETEWETNASGPAAEGVKATLWLETGWAEMTVCVRSGKN